MGYEVKIYIGRACTPQREHQRDLTKPFEDGSGYEFARTPSGELIETGRNEIYFMTYASLDLCCLGGQDDALNRLIQATIAEAKRQSATVHYFYGADGNKRIEQDPYGDPFWPVSAAKVLEAINTLDAETMEYRRLQWAKALLEPMASDAENLQVIFYGH